MFWHAQNSVCEGKGHHSSGVLPYPFWIFNTWLHPSCPQIPSHSISPDLSFSFPASFTTVGVLHYIPLVIWLSSLIDLMLSLFCLCFFKVMPLNQCWVINQVIVQAHLLFHIPRGKNTFSDPSACKDGCFLQCRCQWCTTTEGEWWPLCPPFLRHLSPMPPPTVAEGVRWQVDKNQ